MQEYQQHKHYPRIKFMRFFEACRYDYQNQRYATHYQNKFEVNMLVGHHHQYE